MYAAVVMKWKIHKCYSIEQFTCVIYMCITVNWPEKTDQCGNQSQKKRFLNKKQNLANDQSSGNRRQAIAEHAHGLEEWAKNNETSKKRSLLNLKSFHSELTCCRPRVLNSMWQPLRRSIRWQTLVQTLDRRHLYRLESLAKPSP